MLQQTIPSVDATKNKVSSYREGYLSSTLHELHNPAAEVPNVWTRSDYFSQQLISSDFVHIAHWILGDSDETAIISRILAG